MKKLILFFIAALFAANVSAERGSMVVSGGIDFDFWSSDGYSRREFSISPNFQYFLTDRFSLGIQTQFQTITREQQFTHSELETSTNVFNVGLFGRYYLLKTQRFGVFGQADVGIGFANNEDTPWIASSIIRARIRPGVQYFINNRWSVEARLRSILDFESQRFDDEDRDARTIFRGGLNNTGTSFSVNFHF